MTAKCVGSSMAIKWSRIRCTALSLLQSSNGPDVKGSEQGIEAQRDRVRAIVASRKKIDQRALENGLRNVMRLTNQVKLPQPSPL